MKNGHRGRPGKPETTELMFALIARQLSLSRRTATRINSILDTHIRRGDAARIWVRLVEDWRAHLSILTERIRARLNLDAAGVAAIQTLIAEASAELVVSEEDRASAAMPPRPAAPRAVVQPVKSLAEARSQAARLQARWIDLREGLVKLDDSGIGGDWGDIRQSDAGEIQGIVHDETVTAAIGSRKP